MVLIPPCKDGVSATLLELADAEPDAVMMVLQASPAAAVCAQPSLCWLVLAQRIEAAYRKTVMLLVGDTGWC